MTSLMTPNFMMTFVCIDILYDFKCRSDLYGWLGLDLAYRLKRSTDWEVSLTYFMTPKVMANILVGLT